MNIYKITWTNPPEDIYLTYFREIIVRANDEEEALSIHPFSENYNPIDNASYWIDFPDLWAPNRKEMEVEYLGTSISNEIGVILSNVKA